MLRGADDGHQPNLSIVDRQARSSEQPPVLSIVVVNSDGAKYTLQCLDSIFHNPPQEPFEVILVDNASREPCLPDVQAHFPQVRTISSPVRQGFSKNYNLGIRQSRGTYVMILNNDTVTCAGALDHLINAIRSNPSYGIVGPQLVSPNGQIQTFCARELRTPFSYPWTTLFLDLALPTGQLWDAYLRRRLAKRTSGPVPCIGGACMMTSREILDKVGLLDEGYEFYLEDDEWCHRLKKFGLKVGYVAEAKITHYDHQSLSKVKELAKRSEYQSALRYFRDYYHISIGVVWFLWLVTVIGFFLRMVTFKLIEILAGRSGSARAYWNLFKWIIRQYPRQP